MLRALFLPALALLVLVGCDAQFEDSANAHLVSEPTADASKGAGHCFEDDYAGPLDLSVVSGSTVYTPDYTNYSVTEYAIVRVPICGSSTSNASFRVVADGGLDAADKTALTHSVRARVLINGAVVFDQDSGPRLPSQHATVATDTFGYTLTPGDKVIFLYDYEVETTEGVFRSQQGYEYKYSVTK